MRGNKDTSMDRGGAESVEPMPPCIMEQKEILPVVSYKNPTTLCCSQKVFVIPSTLQTDITCGDSRVAQLAEQDRYLQSTSWSV